MSNGSTSSTIELFQSTLSSRRATPNPITPSTATMDFNPRSPHGERPPFPREGCPSPPYFNPRSPHGERPVTRNNHAVEKRFQSTLSSRRATDEGAGIFRPGVYFNPRSPHGERRANGLRCGTDVDFNPRSPHGERRLWDRFHVFLYRFQSTLSSRRATDVDLPRELILNPFQSTLSSRRATLADVHAGGLRSISIHALLTESDGRCHAHTATVCDISIHALLTESDVDLQFCGRTISWISIHALLTESDPRHDLLHVHQLISIHALLTESDVCVKDGGD